MGTFISPVRFTGMRKELVGLVSLSPNFGSTYGTLAESLRGPCVDPKQSGLYPHPFLLGVGSDVEDLVLSKRSLQKCTQIL